MQEERVKGLWDGLDREGVVRVRTWTGRPVEAI